MNRILILHCGPMKTGSTAIQDTLEINQKKLLKLGISYYHIRAKTLLPDLEEAVAQEIHSNNKILLLSSEFFCQINPKRLKKIINLFNGNCHAILVSRPLREIYPSLYLQNIKGSSRRTTSLQYFLDRQIKLDLGLKKNLGGQLMNFPILDARLRAAGCNTHWILFHRKNLMHNFSKAVEEITGICLFQYLDINIGKAKGLSPRRSLRIEMAALGRTINYLNQTQIISDKVRNILLIFLLNASDILNLFRIRHFPLTSQQLNRCNDVDRSINEPFLKSKGL